MKRCLLLGLAIMLMVSLAGVISCGKVSIPGTYVNEDNPNEYLELNEDGTFYLKEMGIGLSGEWEVKGNELRLQWMGMVFTAEVKGNKLYDEDGKVWVKQSEPSKEETLASLEPTTPAPTPGAAIIGDFSVALSSVEREENVTTLYFGVTKAGDTGSKAGTATIILTDDHDNKYRGYLDIIPQGSPDDFLPLLPAGFAYITSVTIAIPKIAPIARIKLGEAEELAFKDVQFARPSFEQDFGAASIMPGTSFPVGEYLTFTIGGPAGGVIGWVLPVTVSNTEYNPESVDVQIGLQLPDGQITWSEAGSISMNVPGSGQTSSEPWIITLSQGLSGPIGTLPTVLLVYCSEESAGQASLKVMAVASSQFPPLPERIAFNGAKQRIDGTWAPTRDTYVVRVDGSGKTKLPKGTEIGIRGRKWSPDGKKVVRASSSGLGSVIYIENADGSYAMDLTEGWDPAWSPDGTTIAFIRFLAAWKTELCTISSAGRVEPKVLVKGDHPEYPIWSPDSKKIAFYEYYEGYIYVINADGTGKTKLVSGNNPDWSPDGGRIAFESGGSIYVINADGSGKTKLCEGMQPIWIPASTPREATTAPTTEKASPIDFESWAEAAISWAERHLGSDHWYELCLRFVANAFMEQGSPPGEVPEGTWTSAWDAVNGDEDFDLVLNDPDGWQNVPRGALVFFAPTEDNQYVEGKKGNPAGHVGIYLGNGRVIHAYGKVRINDVEQAENLYNENLIGSYIGWAYPPEEWISVPSASLSRTTGSVGTEITVIGTGFLPNAVVTITWDGLQVAGCSTDSDGALPSWATFVAPPSATGEHIITITDGHNAVQCTFTIVAKPL